MIVELWTKTSLISYKRNRMLLTLVSPGWRDIMGGAGYYGRTGILWEDRENMREPGFYWSTVYFSSKELSLCHMSETLDISIFEFY